MNELEKNLLKLLEDHIELTPDDSMRWDSFNQVFVHAIRGNFRSHIKKLGLDSKTERFVLDSLSEPDGQETE